MSRNRKDTVASEGMKHFCGVTGFTIAEAKAAKATPAGASCFLSGNRIDKDAFCRAINTMRRGGKALPLTESEARTQKLIVETRIMERDEKVRDEDRRRKNRVGT